MPDRVHLGYEIAATWTGSLPIETRKVAYVPS